MAGVERAHGRHQRHAVSARPPAADNGPQFNQCSSRLHGNQAFVRRTHRAFVNVVAEALNQGGLMNMAANGAHVIVFGQEKGGTGKSTTAMPVANRTEERRRGKECVTKCKSRRWQVHQKTKSRKKKRLLE